MDSLHIGEKNFHFYKFDKNYFEYQLGISSVTLNFLNLCPIFMKILIFAKVTGIELIPYAESSTKMRKVSTY